VYLYNLEYYNFHQDLEFQRITKSALRIGYLNGEELENGNMLDENLNYLT